MSALAALVIHLARKVHTAEHTRLRTFEECSDPTCRIAAALERDRG